MLHSFTQAVSNIGKELQKPEQRQQMKDDYLARTQQLQALANEVINFFTSTNADAQKIVTARTQLETLNSATGTINQWSTLKDIDEGSRNGVTVILNQVEATLNEYKKEIDSLKAKQPPGP